MREVAVGGGYTNGNSARVEQLLRPAAPAAAGPLDAAAILGHLPIGVLVCERSDNRMLHLHTANDRAILLLGLDPGKAAGARLDERSLFSLGPAAKPLLAALRHAAESADAQSLDWSVDIGGERRCLACSIVPLSKPAGSGAQILCTLTDRTEQDRAERALLHNALHDSLTGLPNRGLFLERLAEALSTRRAKGNHLAVLSINVDRFQLINESFGHAEGDAALSALADSLRGCLRGSDCLARLSADGFAILVGDLAEPADAERLASRIHALLAAPRLICGCDVYLSVSIGIATTRASAGDAESLVRDAEIAMHRAKKAGRAGTLVFEREDHIPPRRQIELETALRRAVEHGELELFYQPILALDSLAPVGFEALARWHHPEHGFVSPGEFIPLAEETGLIVDLGRWALEAACRQLRQWHESLGAAQGLSVNVNLSAVQLAKDDVVAAVCRALDRAGLAGSALRLELTESALIAHPELAAGKLSMLKEMGVGLALDDFGTGYSSLNHLHRFPIDCIKIDRAFMPSPEATAEQAKILRVMTLMARSLEMAVVAEGIEQAEQLTVLRELGCRYGQGYYFARPLPAEDIPPLLSRSAA